jgi:predicted acylesterase/phospholipase RssA
MATTSTPVGLAAPQASGQPRRALVLPGGGLRLSYQVGMMMALEQAGLGFQLMDGTSGGSLNLAMLLSGQRPAEMARRWRSLRLQDTMSFLPLKDYLLGGQLEALADGRGIRDKVLPHLGIAIERVRSASGVQASINLLDYGAKAVAVMPAAEIDADLLVAGMSLPGVFPPLHRNGHTYLDTGFVQDANLSEMVRQGAEELWVLWGLGNTGVYRGDPLHLYVQMLEMSANAALNQQLAEIQALNARIARGDSPFGQTRAIRVHVLRPDHPLPLDPDLYTGRIDHADGCRYLAQAGSRPPLTDNPSRMIDPVPGVRLRFEFAGELQLAQDGSRRSARLSLCVHVHDLAQFIAAAEPQASLSGRLQLDPGKGTDAEPMPVSGGRYRQITLPDRAREINYRMLWQTDEGRALTLSATQILRDDAGPDMWRDLSTLSVRLSNGDTLWASGELRLAMSDLKSWLASVQATETCSTTEAGATVASYARFFLRQLHAVYGWG